MSSIPKKYIVIKQLTTKFNKVKITSAMTGDLRGRFLILGQALLIETTAYNEFHFAINR